MKRIDFLIILNHVTKKCCQSHGCISLANSRPYIINGSQLVQSTSVSDLGLVNSRLYLHTLVMILPKLLPSPVDLCHLPIPLLKHFHNPAQNG